MTPIECVVCDAKTDALLCPRCTRKVAVALGDLPALLHELDVTLSRQDRGTGAALYAMRRSRLQQPGLHYEEGESTLPATPWPFSWDASNLRWDVESTVVTWARHLLEARGIDTPLGAVLGAAELLAETSMLTAGIGQPGAFLLSSIESIRLDEAAEQIYDEITHVHRALLRAIDRQDPDIFAGKCDAPDVRADLVDGVVTPRVSTCGAELYANLGDSEVKCGVCGQVYELAPRLSKMADAVDDHWARPRLIADALTTLDEPVNFDTLRKWIERDGKLKKPVDYPLVLQVGIDDDGHALFRVGDVRARIAWARGRAKTERASA